MAAWTLCSVCKISFHKQTDCLHLSRTIRVFANATIACYFTFAYNLHGFFKLFLVVFLGSAFFDLLVNLIPNETPVKLHDGSIIYNDGYSLKQLFYFKRLPKEYSEAADLYNEQKFADAAVLFEKILFDTKHQNIYRLAISSYMQNKNWRKAKEIADAFLLTGKMNSDDLSNIALSCSELGHYKEALKLYDKSLQLNPDNKGSLNNKGYTLNLMNRFEEAISLFDRAVAIDKEFAYSCNNRAFAKIKSGKAEEGLQDLNRSFELDPDNSSNYRNLGVYHFDRGEFGEALRLFTKAKELDRSTHLIDDLLNAAKLKLPERK